MYTSKLTAALLTFVQPVPRRHGVLDAVRTPLAGSCVTWTRCGQVTQHDNGWSSAQLTLLLYGWDGADDSLATLMYDLPFRGAPRVTFIDKSARLVSRAASLVTPRGGAGSSPTKSASSSLGRRSTRSARTSAFDADSSAFDDASSTRSGAGGGSFVDTPRRRSAQHNQMQ